MSKSEQELDSLFNTDNSTALIQKAKRKNIQQNVYINLVILLVAAALLTIIKWWVTPYLLTHDTAQVESYYDVYGANMYVGPWEEHPRLLGSSATAPVYKLVDGIPVQLKTIQHKNNSMDSFVTSAHGQFRTNGQRVMEFAHPNVLYKTYTTDLSSLQDDVYYEVALSFSQSFSLDELADRFPKSIQPTWFWIDIFDKESLKTLQKDQILLTENEVPGITTIDEGGSVIPNPFEQFKKDVDRAIAKNNGTTKKNLQQVEEAVKSSPKIIGAVVTGTGSELQEIKQLGFIKNSSIGSKATH